MIDPLKYAIKGEDLPLAEGLTVHNPTFAEVVAFGEEKYMYLVSSLLVTPQDMMVQLDDMGVDFETVDPFDFFVGNFTKLPLAMLTQFEGDMLQAVLAGEAADKVALSKKLVESTAILFGDLEIGEFHRAKDEKTQEVGLYHKQRDLFLTKAQLNSLTEFLRLINCREKQKPRNFASDFVKKTIIEYERDKLKRHQRHKQKEPSMLANYVSVLVNTAGFKYDYQTVFDLKMSQFFDALMRCNKITEYNNIVRAIYAGTIDVKKMQDKTVLDVFRSNF